MPLDEAQFAGRPPPGGCVLADLSVGCLGRQRVVRCPAEKKRPQAISLPRPLKPLKPQSPLK